MSYGRRVINGLRLVWAVFLSSHPIPGAVVTLIVAVVGFGLGVSAPLIAAECVIVGMGQFSVGLSNDLVDKNRDIAAARKDKPLATGRLSPRVATPLAIIMAIVALLLGFLVGLWFGLLHGLALASAWSYNLFLKPTLLSALPYLVSFGLLPLAVWTTVAAPEPLSPWMVVGAAALGLSAHFANVIPDLEHDRQTGVLGLPQRLGLSVSLLAFGLSFSIAAFSFALVRFPMLLAAHVALFLIAWLIIGRGILKRESGSSVPWRLALVVALAQAGLLSIGR